MRAQIRNSFSTFYDALLDVIEGLLRWARDWISLDYGVKPCEPVPCPSYQEMAQDAFRTSSRLRTAVNAAFGGHGTVTLPLQPFLDLQFEVNAGTGTGVIERAHDLVRAVEFPRQENLDAIDRAVFPETPVPTLKRVLSAADVVIGNTIIYCWEDRWELSIVRSKYTFGWDFDKDPMYVVPHLSVAPHILREDES